VTLPDLRVIEYVIDGENRRVAKKVDGVIQLKYLWDGPLRVIAELDANDNVVSRFVYGDGVNVPEYMVKGGHTYRLVKDHLGSPRLVVDISDGSTEQRLDYDEFGNVVADSSPGFQPFGFAGGLYDADAGLVRFGARDYDAHSGRWMSKDPIGFRGRDTNIYAFVGGDPINRSDPTGLRDWDSTLSPYPPDSVPPAPAPPAPWPAPEPLPAPDPAPSLPSPAPPTKKERCYQECDRRYDWCVSPLHVGRGPAQCEEFRQRCLKRCDDYGAPAAEPCGAAE